MKLKAKSTQHLDSPISFLKELLKEEIFKITQNSDYNKKTKSNRFMATNKALINVITLHSRMYPLHGYESPRFP